MHCQPRAPWGVNSAAMTGSTASKPPPSPSREKYLDHRRPNATWSFTKKLLRTEACCA
ncbi:hypothetical protein OH77DRAFT_1421660 [Trametes cingulata]|nr:hypothetical protein OH77DRAFT_1421660 [Trametes cingulata]